VLPRGLPADGLPVGEAGGSRTGGVGQPEVEENGRTRTARGGGGWRNGADGGVWSGGGRCGLLAAGRGYRREGRVGEVGGRRPAAGSGAGAGRRGGRETADGGV
jgi:hypothetical protein